MRKCADERYGDDAYELHIKRPQAGTGDSLKVAMSGSGSWLCSGVGLIWYDVVIRAHARILALVFDFP